MSGVRDTASQFWRWFRSPIITERGGPYEIMLLIGCLLGAVLVAGLVRWLVWGWS